jgi:hypothetical protein
MVDGGELASPERRSDGPASPEVKETSSSQKNHSVEIKIVLEVRLEE